MKSNNRWVPATVLIIMISLTAGVQAAVLSFQSTAPNLGKSDIANFVGALSDVDNVGTATTDGSENDGTTYVAMDRPGQGQTFVTGTHDAGYTLTGLWVRHPGYTENTDSTWYMMPVGSQLLIRITDPAASGTDEFVLASETYVVTGSESNVLPAEITNTPNGTGLWINVALDTPVTLAPETEYGFDLTGVYTTGFGADMFFEILGIRDDTLDGNPYPAGSAYTTGDGGVADNTLIAAPGDRVFIVELDEAVTGLKVIWVSEEQDVDLDDVQDDQAFIDLLTEVGYDVDVRLDHWAQLDDDKIETLEAAHLVIVSPAVSSEYYTSDMDVTSTWNNLNVPLIQMQSHMTRSKQWRFFNTTGVLPRIPRMTEVLDSTHPIFAGLSLDESNMIQLHDPNVGSGRSTFITAVNAGNGTILASNGGLILVAEWPQGVEYYNGANQWAGGPRLFFTAGTREVRGSQPKGAMNLNKSGRQAFLNAVYHMIPKPMPYPLLSERITATASSTENATTGPEKTIDGSGLNDSDGHSALDADMWVSANPDIAPWIQYEFDDVYRLDRMLVWNGNRGAESVIGWGLKDITLETSVDGTTWAVIEGVTQLSQAPGINGTGPTDDLDLGGLKAKYVRISITNNWGRLLFQYSLSEIRFYYLARRPLR